MVYSKSDTVKFSGLRVNCSVCINTAVLFIGIQQSKQLLTVTKGGRAFQLAVIAPKGAIKRNKQKMYAGIQGRNCKWMAHSCTWSRSERIYASWRFSVIFRVVSHTACCTARYNFFWAGGPLVFAADVFISLWGENKCNKY